MPATVYFLVVVIRWDFLSGSGANEARDRRRGFLELPVGLGSTEGRRVCDAVLEVFVEQGQGHRLKGGGDGRDLRDDVDAVLVLLDHPLEAARLTLDPPKPTRVVALARDVPRLGGGHRCLLRAISSPNGTRAYNTPLVYARSTRPACCPYG